MRSACAVVKPSIADAAGAAAVAPCAALARGEPARVGAASGAAPSGRWPMLSGESRTNASAIAARARLRMPISTQPVRQVETWSSLALPQ